MAQNITPIFPYSGVDGGASIASILGEHDGANGTTVLTAGANGAQWTRIFFNAITATGGGKICAFIYNGSTYTLVGWVDIPNDWAAGSPSLSIANPDPNVILKAARIIKCGKIGQAGTIDAHACANDY